MLTLLGLKLVVSSLVDHDELLFNVLHYLIVSRH